jgi:23S rRNA (cytidine1920-2'-O)/16S rRNA (cytidine1409-2'-O)-methyltransferase
MAKNRLDQTLFSLKLVTSRSQAETYIKLGKVFVDNKVVTKPGFLVSLDLVSKIRIEAGQQYVSRAALKLASVFESLGIEFKDKVVLDVGSSTGGFTDFALRHGARRVIAVDSGTNQLHSDLRVNPKIELHEKTDIRDFVYKGTIDIILIDVSFISIREIVPHVRSIVERNSLVVAMVKPQFEASNSNLKHKGVIKNDSMRRQILKDFEIWVKQYFTILNKQDSGVTGAKGNQERFYLLQKA